MSKILSLNDVRALWMDFAHRRDFDREDIADLLTTLERYACAIENNWSVQNYCKYCGAVIQEWPLVGTNTGPVCHHSLDCVVMQVKGAG